MGFLDRFTKGKPASPPKPDQPMQGASGRGHTEGFLDLEELNNDLRHPHGHKVYDRMYRTDGDVKQVVSLVCDPIISGTWQMSAYGGDEASDEEIEVAEFAKWALWECMQPNLLGHLQIALPILVRSGFVPFEIAWMKTEYNGKTVVVPRTMQPRMPRTIWQFEQDRWGELRRIKQVMPVPISTLTGREGMPTVSNAFDDSDSFGGVWLEAQNLLYYRVGAEGDNWEGVSMLRPAYKHWIMKDKIERIDAIAQEREAVGVPICYPPPGASDAQKDEMASVLENMRSNEQAYIIAPGPKQGSGAADGTGWLIEVIGYDRTGSGRDPQPSLQYHTAKIAAAFISEFMRLGHGNTGARATAQVQQDPFLMSVEALVHIVEDVLNTLVVKLISYNYPEIENPPRLQMSLVDSTSLTQLADYVLKLTQVGALFPDQELEDFLRARADLPPSNPESVKKRKSEDDKLRREIVTGGGDNGDAYGANAGAGKHGIKGAGNPGSNSGKGQGSSTDASKRARDDDDTITLAYTHEETGRQYWREPRDFELAVDLVGLEDVMDTCQLNVEGCLKPFVMEMARGSVPDDIEELVLDSLNANYASGRESVARELGLTLLDRGANDRGDKALKQRAGAASMLIRATIADAMLNADLSHGDDNIAHTQLAAERAGIAAAKRLGRVHGIGAFLQGRHDMALDSSGNIKGVRYTAILDRNCCSHCEQADDGVIRDLDDPVRLDRRPPNRHCESTAGGVNMCRCFEVYVTG